MAAPLDPRLLPHLRPAARPLAVVVAGQVVAGALVVAQAFAVTALVVRLLDDPGGTGWLEAAWWVLGVLAARAAVGAVVDVAAVRAAGRVGAHLRRVVVEAILRPGEQTGGRTGRRDTPSDRALLATRGVAAVEPYLTRYLPSMVVAAVLPPLTVLAIATQDLPAALVVLATVPLVPVFAALVGFATRDRAERRWRALAQLSGHFLDVVRGLPTLVAHRRAGAQSQVVRRVTDRYRRSSQDVLRLAFASSAVLELVATISVALVAVTVGLRLAGGSLDLTTALVVLLLAPEAYWPLRRVGAEFHAAAEGTATFEAIDELAGRRSSPDDGTDAADAAEVVPRGPLRLEGVTLRWPGRTGAAVRELTATFPAVGLTALTGPSGSGKSTVLAALLGELEPEAGVVSVAGTPLGEIPDAAWRRQVAHLEQRPWLRDATVADNLRLARPGIGEEVLREALAAVDLDLPLDHRLSEDGAGLSAGQRARLGLARVLVADRPVVLLDEPTAHLDAATEAVLVVVVRELARDRCVVVVAHRPAIVAAADHEVSLPAPSDIRSHLGHPGHPADHGTARATEQRAARPATEDADAPAAAPARTALRLAGAAALAVLAASSGVALTATAGWLIARSAEQPPVLTLMVAIVGVRTFGIARPVLRYLERLLAHDTALLLLAERRAQVYDDLVPLVPGALGRRRGDLLAAVVDDVDALLDQRLRVRLPLVTWLGTSALVAGVLTLWSGAAAAIVLGAALSSGALAWGTAHHGARRSAVAAVQARAALSERVLEVVTDAAPLRRWQAEASALADVEQAGEVLHRATAAAGRWLAWARTWPLLGAGAAMVAVASVSAPELVAGTLTPPVAALLVLVPLALVEVLTPTADAGSLGVATRAAAARLDALAATSPAVLDPERPSPAPAGTGVELAAVRAGWPGAASTEPVTLALAPGTTVGVVGPSGSGKSTLAAVLLRFLGPRTGRHLLDGVDVTELRADDVRRTVGLLDDDPYLFASTLAENVRLARPGADDAAVAAALRVARLGPWLDALPEGLDTLLGVAGGDVSGGERARIGLARLLLADQPVLVLDEPTAHLDAATAREVAEQVLGDPGGRSVVWITHTSEGLDRVDEVLRLEGADRLLPAVRPR